MRVTYPHKRAIPRQMAHTKAAQLLDLEHEFAVLRSLPGLKEKSPGIFYFRSTSFLHFHDKEGKRWADVKVGGSWQSVDVDFGASGAARARFLKAAKAAHAAISLGRS